ncbi:MAG: tyrosine-type recombinase/integrase, partial [Candidatus Komeilibacteria bacterium]|nr:tyrosine-type recombinase/integrase [Candidatus Komeilibacteria bacterium]
SKRTIKSYLAHNRRFLATINKSAREVTVQDIKNYLLYLRVQERYSNTSLNNVISALKFYYEGILKRRLFSSIKRPKREKFLPVVLTRQEIARLLDTVQNRKHRLLLAVAYGAGLRVSEAVRLQVRDIDLEALTIHVRGAKGAKDRITIFPEKIVNDMRECVSGKKASDPVFASWRGGALTTRTAQKIFEQALARAGVQKSATFHSLRHSFATHLLENGVAARYVQELLGHQSIKTTEHYMQVTNPQLKHIRSPL